MDVSQQLEEFSGLFIHYRKRTASAIHVLARNGRGRVRIADHFLGVGRQTEREDDRRCARCGPNRLADYVLARNGRRPSWRTLHLPSLGKPGASPLVLPVQPAAMSAVAPRKPPLPGR